MNATALNAVIHSLTTEFTPVLANHLKKEDYVKIDLSTAYLNKHQIELNTSVEVEKYIQSSLQKQNGKVAYGGYKEVRSLYTRSHLFNSEDADSTRNIHLGIDFWSDANTEVITPLDGIIHSKNDNKGLGNYGPTIILEHHFKETQFYTLYGHLTRDSLSQNKIGKKIKKGISFAQLGTSLVNGDYAPHLHFQIIKSIENYSGDYPGVCSQKDLPSFSANCPDPAVLLKI